MYLTKIFQGLFILFAITIFLLGAGVQIFIVGMLSELIVHNKERDKKKSYSIQKSNIENH